jgi:hypothetical protein
MIGKCLPFKGIFKRLDESEFTGWWFVGVPKMLTVASAADMLTELLAETRKGLRNYSQHDSGGAFAPFKYFSNWKNCRKRCARFKM